MWTTGPDFARFVIEIQKSNPTKRRWRERDLSAVVVTHLSSFGLDKLESGNAPSVGI